MYLRGDCYIFQLLWRGFILALLVLVELVKEFNVFFIFKFCYSGGVGRTGVFISVFNSVERLKAKDVVDVFQTTRALRLQRTAMVQTIVSE